MTLLCFGGCKLLNIFFSTQLLSSRDELLTTTLFFSGSSNLRCVPDLAGTRAGVRWVFDLKNDDTRVGENPRTTIIEAITFALVMDLAPFVESDDSLSFWLLCLSYS